MVLGTRTANPMCLPFAFSMRVQFTPAAADKVGHERGVDLLPADLEVAGNPQEVVVKAACLLDARRAWWVAEIAGVARVMAEQTDEPKTILDQGYLIVRGAIEAERLKPLRATAELFLDRARERSRGDPNVGWDAHRVPHPGLYDFIDEDTAVLFDPLVSDRVLDVNRRLMAAPEVGLNTASLFTEPAKPLSKIFQWHRDSVLRPSSPLPMNGLQADCQANAPGVLSWNIALHDDDSLWVVPGSNRRGNTAAEQEVFDRPAQLADEPLPGGRAAASWPPAMPWCSTRRWSTPAAPTRIAAGAPSTLPTGSSAARCLAHSRATCWRPDLFESLTPETARRFERFERLLRDERDVIEAAFRAVIERDGARVPGALGAPASGAGGPHGLRGAASQDRARALEARRVRR